MQCLRSACVVPMLYPLQYRCNTNVVPVENQRHACVAMPGCVRLLHPKRRLRNEIPDDPRSRDSAAAGDPPDRPPLCPVGLTPKPFP